MSRRDAQEALDQQLEESRVRLLSGNGPPALLTTLRSVFPDLSDNVYIIEWLPEQGEDIYDVLVDATTVVHVEVPRPGVVQRVVIDQMSLERYREIHSSLSKLDRRRLDAILRLSRQRRR
jgi:hypothetical protein